MWQTVACELEGRCGHGVISIDISKFIERQVKILTNPMFGNIQDVMSLSTYRGVNKPNPIPRSGIKGTSIATTLWKIKLDLEVRGRNMLSQQGGQASAVEEDKSWICVQKWEKGQR